MSPETIAPPPALGDLPEVRGSLVADLQGAPPEGAEGADPGARTAGLARALAELADEAGMERLLGFVVRSPSRIEVAVVRGGRLLQVTVAPGSPTAAVERVLAGWAPAEAPAASEPAAAVGPAAAPEDPAPGPPSPPPSPGVADPSPGGPAPAEPVPEAEGEAIGAADLAASLASLAEAASRGAPVADPWAALRRALSRGQLTDASALRGALAHAAPAEGPDAEGLAAAARERALDQLLEGLGSILSGDPLAGLRTLRSLVVPPHPSPSIRWLAVQWSTLAALRCGNLPAARWFAKEAVHSARQLDPEAHAASQWVAAEVLAGEGGGERALSWAREARARFERLGDPWGLARACFAEARVLVALGREEEAAGAARHAWAHDPGWDEPAVFLAERALLRGSAAEAEELLRTFPTAGADRVRLLAEGIRGGAVSAADARELLRLVAVPPAPEAARALERLARASPRLPVAREALAWMLLRAGRYVEAGTHFDALVAARLTPAIRSSVMLGLGCVAHARGAGAGASPEGAAGVPAAPAAGPAGAASPSPEAVFSGRLSVFAVPDLLEFLRGARRTGLLTCSTAAGPAALQFRDGRLTGAASPATPGVGELLVRARRLSPVVLQAVLDGLPGADRSDGAVAARLVREALLGADEVRAALREQIGLAVKEIVDWREGDFAFSRGDAAPEPPGAVTVEVDPQEVLLDVLRQQDEASRDGGRG